MINDVSMLRNGAKLAEAAAEAGADLVLMHSRKTPKDMQVDIEYDDVVTDVIAELKHAVERAEAAGVKPAQIWLDPGIGFAKTAEHNLELLARLPKLAALGFPILVNPAASIIQVHFGVRQIRNKRDHLSADKKTADLFHFGLRANGVMASYHPLFLSAAHNEKHIQRTLETAEWVLSQIK